MAKIRQLINERLIYMWVVQGRFYLLWISILLLLEEAMKSYNPELTPENVVLMLHEKGLDITREQAKSIIELLYILAELEVKQHLENENC